MSWLSTGPVGRFWDEVRHKRLQASGDTEDFLFVTWDSCRFDVYQQAHTPVLDHYDAARKAWAMATYTLPAHQAMFAGFLPHVFEHAPLYNRYVQQMWRISHRKIHAKPLVTFPEGTENVVCGFQRRGYCTVGTAAMDWFEKPSPLQNGFDRFNVMGTKASAQIDWIQQQIRRHAGNRPTFAFLNFGETHSPFRYEGMAPLPEHVTQKMSLRRLFNQQGLLDDSHPMDHELFERQRECAEFLDRKMGELLQFFIERGRPTTVIVCADHGECLGEQGLYGHAIYHPKVMEVPLLIFRLNAPPHAAPEPSIEAPEEHESPTSHLAA